MISRLLALFLGRRCGLCWGRYRDLAGHQLHDHTDAELMQWRATR